MDASIEAAPTSYSKEQDESLDPSEFAAKFSPSIELTDMRKNSVTKELDASIDKGFFDKFDEKTDEEKENEALSLFKAGDYSGAYDILDNMDTESFDTLTCYYIAECFDGKVKNEPMIAQFYYEKAMTQAPNGTSEDVGEAYYLLSKKYTKGGFFGEDLSKEKELLERAANYGETRSLYNLGIIYKSTDLEKAIEYFEAAASDLPEKAYMQLGKCYSSEKNPKKDYDKAIKCYELAAKYGDTASMVNLGNMYYYGTGTVQSFANAHMWYLKAARLGNAIAQYNIGRCYQLGRGVKPDQVLADEWFERAKANGYKPKKSHS
jgi:TPR repeat protein